MKLSREIYRDFLTSHYPPHQVINKKARLYIMSYGYLAGLLAKIRRLEASPKSIVLDKNDINLLELALNEGIKYYDHMNEVNAGLHVFTFPNEMEMLKLRLLAFRKEIAQ